MKMGGARAAEADRGQRTLLPECLGDFVDEDDPVRVIDVFVDALDFAEMSFAGVEPAATGRPSYHPSVLLKLYIYGYLNRVQSSRRLEREAGRNVEVMWLLGRLGPDHKTIADFRKDNGLALRKVCARRRSSPLRRGGEYFGRRGYPEPLSKAEPSRFGTSTVLSQRCCTSLSLIEMSR
jgi:transposase